MAGAPIQVSSIDQAMDRVMLASGVKRNILASSLRAVDAGPLLKMVKLCKPDGELEAEVDKEGGKKVEPWRGKLTNLEAVEGLHSAAHALDLLETYLLPRLLRLPTSKLLLRALDRCTNALKVDAAQAGGYFNVAVHKLIVNLRAFAAAARATKPTESYADLHANIEDL